MTELASEPMAAEPLSTVIDTNTEAGPSGGGVPKLTEDKPEPSLRDTIAAVVKEEGDAREKVETDPKDAKEQKGEKPEIKADEKAEDKPKVADRAPDGKFVPKAKDEAANDTGKVDDAAAKAEEKSGENKHYPEPPKNFLPDSKEMWRNVPRPVRRDIEIMVREHTEAMDRTKAHTERYESIRPFDELARSNGRDLRESLAQMNHVENLMRRNPIAGLDAILKEIGPRKTDGGAISLYEVAQHIVQQGPQGYQQIMAQAQQEQPRQPDPEVQRAQQELAETKARLIAVEVIAPFKADHPRFDELQEPIAAILQSAMISPSLSAAERLEAAYVMAERLHPPSSPAPDEAQQAPAPESRAADSLVGQKSIKSAPGAVTTDMESERGGSIRELLQDELRRQRRS
jgi:hypothetical protein